MQSHHNLEPTCYSQQQTDLYALPFSTPPSAEQEAATLSLGYISGEPRSTLTGLRLGQSPQKRVSPNVVATGGLCAKLSPGVSEVLKNPLVSLVW